jgi:preprotein translocase subunit YajC
MRKYFSLAAISLAIFQIQIVLAETPPVPAGGAPAGDPTAGGPPQPSLFMGVLPFILMFGIIWLLVLRPQQKKMQEQQSMLNSLKHGDQVVTNSGMLGKVTGITDKVVTLEIADNVRVKMIKTQVSQVVKDGQVKDLNA